MRRAGTPHGKGEESPFVSPFSLPYYAGYGAACGGAVPGKEETLPPPSSPARKKKGGVRLKSFCLRLKLRYLMWRYEKIRDHIRLLERDLALLAKEIQKVRRKLG